MGVMGPADTSRRRVLGALTALAACLCIPRLAISSTGEVSNLAGGLDEFLRLSAIVTGVDRLDRETGQRIFDLIRAEPWGKEHLAQISAKLLPTGDGNPPSGTRQHLFAPERFTEGERWFIGHLMTTWFTGVYYHQTGNHVVVYRTALMHTALQDVRPIPGYCEGAFGSWAKPPAGVVE